MKIIFLNSWFGKAGEKYIRFIKKHAESTDIFCFMEFSPELFNKVSNILKNHQGFIEKGRISFYFGVPDCQVLFIKNGIKVKKTGRITLYRETNMDTGFASYATVETDKTSLTVINVHGKTRPGHKFDTLARINQSQRIIDFLKSKKSSKIVGGDFNLMPNTQSVKMFEKAGFRNLIKEFNIKSTRNRISWEQFKNEPGFVKQYFADYAFVSKEVKVKKFSVPDTEISDHLPLILDFEL